MGQRFVLELSAVYQSVTASGQISAQGVPLREYSEICCQEIPTNVCLKSSQKIPSKKDTSCNISGKLMPEGIHPQLKQGN